MSRTSSSASFRRNPEPVTDGLERDFLELGFLELGLDLGRAAGLLRRDVTPAGSVNRFAKMTNLLPRNGGSAPHKALIPPKNVLYM